MSVPARIAAFLASLMLAFGVAIAVGSAVGPTNRAAEQEAGKEAHGMSEDAPALPQGLSVANDEFRLVAETEGFTPGRERKFRFRIQDRDGETVRDFEIEHEKRLHLIVVRRDLTRYVHVHPVEQADGSWTVPLRFGDPGTYRVFADFTAAGAERTTLGADITVPGDARAEPLPGPVTSASTDGYDVAISSKAGAGDDRELAFTVTRDAQAVQVEPYLGADGHLVVLRQGDLAYLHAHTEEDEEAEGGPIGFTVEYPSAGSYRMFLQFKHEGRVHTVAFTQEVE
jgi:hypothetical protein